ncbi:MAG: 4'-phosphopantetheinyl transferase superfamily protein, partial [Chitinophagaceae bacterium]
KRLQHLAGRYLLQYLFPDFPISLIKIAGTRKPYLENEAYHFSISHCSEYAAAIVSSTKRVGVDIEVPTLKVQKIMHKFLHEEELKMLSGEWTVVSGQSVNIESIETLTLLWNAKEAVFKWWSYGNVDFSEMIRLQPFLLQPEGMIEGAFVSDRVLPLQLHYKTFEGVSLAWIANDLRQ